MKLAWFVVALVACGEKIDPGDDSGTGPDGTTSPDTSTKLDAHQGVDVSLPPPPPNCSPISGNTVVSSDGSCEGTATWTCGATQYTVDCTCPQSQCTCTQQTGSSGSGTIIKPPSV